MKITGTFLDEISYDIPHQNWGRKEWEADFQRMHSIGIDTVILIRCGLRRWMTYPSQCLPVSAWGVCRLWSGGSFPGTGGTLRVKFFMGTYVPDITEKWRPRFREQEINRAVINEVWEKYGHRKAFQGWYLTQEISRKMCGTVDIYAQIGRLCKELSNNLPVMISPYIDGMKSISAFNSDIIRKDRSISVEEHAREWNDVLSGIQDAG